MTYQIVCKLPYRFLQSKILGQDMWSVFICDWKEILPANVFGYHIFRVHSQIQRGQRCLLWRAEQLPAKNPREKATKFIHRRRTKAYVSACMAGVTAVDVHSAVGALKPSELLHPQNHCELALRIQRLACTRIQGGHVRGYSVLKTEAVRFVGNRYHSRSRLCIEEQCCQQGVQQMVPHEVGGEHPLNPVLAQGVLPVGDANTGVQEHHVQRATATLFHHSLREPTHRLEA